MFAVKKRGIRAAAVLLCLLLMQAVCAAFAEGQPALKIEPAELTLEKGKGQKLKVTAENAENPKKIKYAWESSDESVATAAGGTVKAKDGGTAVITCTATLEDGSTLTAEVPVTVTVPVKGLKIGTKANTAVRCGESLQIEYTITPENATDRTVTWSSSDESVLKADENGTVTGIGAGKATITGKTANGKSAKVALTVPSLHAGAEEFAVTATENIYKFLYCGNNFEGDIRIAQTGDCFGYALIMNGQEIGISLTPVKPGEGTLTITDRKDKTAGFTVKITVGDDAFPQGKILQIQGAQYHPETGMLEIIWTNTGSSAVTSAELRINPLDAEGKPVLIGEGKTEDIPDEVRVLHSAANVPAGETVTETYAAGTLYPAAAEMNIAFDRFVREDGSVTELPDDRLCWFSTAGKAYTAGPERSEPYAMPSEETLAAAADVRFGFRAIAVPGEIAGEYGFSRGGLLVTETEDGSAAEAIGLEVGDLIIGAGETAYEEEPYIIPLAAAALTRGEAITLWIERDGETEAIELESGE